LTLLRIKKIMKVTIFGSGYVGLVTGACLAEVGNDVLCVDIDQRKVDMLQGGEIPIYEPGLDDLVNRSASSGRLAFSTEVAQGVAHGLFQFIAVGTPPDEDGSADLHHVLAVARSIGEHMTEFRIIVNKSTVPVGTADKVRDTVKAVLDERGSQLQFDVVSNPEFLKEGGAIDDFMRPDRIVIGTDNPRTTELLRILYSPFNRNHERLVEMDIRSAELTKYAANAMLATKISFMNELANLAELLNADVEQVRLGIGADPRIGYHFIYPGCGYGGSCFPKDVKALARTAYGVGFDAQLLNTVEAVNQRQKGILFEKIQRHFGNDLQNRTFALWGLAFKPNTDDMREAPSRTLMEALWAAGARVQGYDPAAMSETLRLYGKRDDLRLYDTPEEALQEADALVILTEWNVFRSPDFEAMKKVLKTPVIFDGRNLYDPAYLGRAGFLYYAVGRGNVPLQA
jgi:UDPglucose 6-dehydrogenase